MNPAPRILVSSSTARPRPNTVSSTVVPMTRYTVLKMMVGVCGSSNSRLKLANPVNFHAVATRL